jgi:hypothetical protein
LAQQGAHPVWIRSAPSAISNPNRVEGDQVKGQAG